MSTEVATWVEMGVMVTPSGRLALTTGTSERVPAALAQRLREAFAISEAEALLHLATEQLQASLPADLAYLRGLARDYLTAVCHQNPSDARELPPVPPPASERLAFDAMRCPPIPGGEYVTPGTLARWWQQLDEHVRELARTSSGGLGGLLQQRSPLWRTVGRVTFHLAENKKDQQRPFAFMATYTNRVSDAGRPQHLPLGRALQEYAGAGNRDGLLKLLGPVNEAAQRSAFVRTLVDSGAVYRASAWTSADAYAFLQNIAAMEDAGLIVRVPDWWKSRRPARPIVSVKVGEQRKSGLGFDALLDFQVDVTLDGQPLSPDEIQAMLQQGGNLIRLRQQWVELDREKLEQALQHWRAIEARAHDQGISFADALRLTSGMDPAAEQLAPDTPQWTGIEPGAWLAEVLRQMRDPRADDAAQHPHLHAELRPYQKAGVQWLRFMCDLGLGACLADDMGLGKTIQVITLLLHQQSSGHGTSLLVAPASLLANWMSELKRFAPTLRCIILHPSEMPPGTIKAMSEAPELTRYDLVMTTYGMLLRTPWLNDVKWRAVILDEAQAIKNPGTRQTAAAWKLQGAARIAMTGTPVENRLSDLWSLFRFVNPGLLGSADAFGKYVKRLASAQTPDYRPLRTLIKPYILRRLKTDKSIIADLPEKTELKAWCALSRQQATLYQQALDDLEQQLEKLENIQRRGTVLATLLRLKQICNHPSQWLGDGQYTAGDSGKFARLRELCEELAERQQKVLVFTQFAEITGPLSAYLQQVFGRPGLVLHGGTAVKSRKGMVDEFAREDGPPFFVLSIKAGGTGLNLTAASTVIHFDRWWNPAVENQATDRAFRIGQKNNVLVHKFVCRGTVEEKIDALIEEKTALSRDVLEGGAESSLTEMNDRELMQFLSLDLRKATET